MSDFKSFNQNRQTAQSDGQANEKTEQSKGQPNARAAANLAQEVAKAFYGKSQKDVWQAIIAQAEKGKKDGTLTNADLDNFYSSAYPILNGAQRQKLKSIIKKLKEL